MDLSFTDEQEFLRDAVRGVVEREGPLSRVRDWVLGEHVDHGPAHALAVRQGWTGIGIPEEAGGQGGGMLELAILAEELGRGAVPADALYGTLLAALALSRCSDERAGAHVEALAAGEASGALARPGDSPADAPPADGALQLVLGAPGATLLVGWDGQALEVHDAAAAQVTPRRLVDRTRAVADVVLRGEPVDRFDGVGADDLRALTASAAVLVAADALGAAQRMLDLTVEYVGQRVQFGVPVGSFQAVKHAAAEMLVSIEGTRAAVHYAAWAVGAGEPGAEVDAWVAKARAARAASSVADKALFLHGAVGYTWEHDLQLLFKRAKSDAELFGGAGVYDDRIADALELVPAASLAGASD
ncbi:MAG: acyl-CoA dehydrogenase [Actinobacteria bacterium]|nr:MAG: acyl-CoA dehydrogenase [Actinomycetota bacterium]